MVVLPFGKWECFCVSEINPAAQGKSKANKVTKLSKSAAWKKEEILRSCVCPSHITRSKNTESVKMDCCLKNWNYPFKLQKLKHMSL